MAYTNLQTVKQYLGITASTADDPLLVNIINRAQAIIDGYCHRSFEATADTTRYFDAIRDVRASSKWYGNGYRYTGDMLYLDEDLCAITTVTNGDNTTVTSSQYVTEPRNRSPYYALTIRSDADIVWTYSDYPENAISIVGRWAYSTTAPDNIQHACIRLVAYMFKQKDNLGDLDRPVVAGDILLLPAQIPSDLKAILEPYRKRT